MSLTEEHYQAAEQNGISRALTKRRYDRKWSIEEIINTPRGKWRGTSWWKIALQRGISETSYYYRIDVLGMTPEQAATTPRMGKGGKKRKNTA